MMNQGWVLPEQSYIHPNILPTSVETPIIPALSVGKVTVKELVFFGRLERRKGLWIFLEALDLIWNDNNKYGCISLRYKRKGEEKKNKKQNQKLKGWNFKHILVCESPFFKYFFHLSLTSMGYMYSVARQTSRLAALQNTKLHLRCQI
jgi:hypothetical protein